MVASSGNASAQHVLRVL